MDKLKQVRDATDEVSRKNTRTAQTGEPVANNHCEVCEHPEKCQAGECPCDLSGEFHWPVSTTTANYLLDRVAELEAEVSRLNEGWQKANADALEHVVRLNGYQDWSHADERADQSQFAAMKLHALDRDKWMAEKAELEAEIARLNEGWHKQNVAALEDKLNWQDNMDFDPSEGAVEKAKEMHIRYHGIDILTVARLIDHLEGTVPEQVDDADEQLSDLIRVYHDHGRPAALAKFKELTNG